MSRYAACFCEENIWWLCQETRFSDAAAEVVFISNQNRCCAMYGQKAASEPGAPVFWDYHVVLYVKAAGRQQIWDLDCQAGAPMDAKDWLALTFAPAQHLPDFVWPRFRIVPAPLYIERFSSDRAHMLDQNGKPMLPFPSWPAIGSGDSNLSHFINMNDAFLGEVTDLTGIRERWSY